MVLYATYVKRVLHISNSKIQLLQGSLLSAEAKSMSLLIGVLVLQPPSHMMDARNKAKPMRHLIQLMEVL